MIRFLEQGKMKWRAVFAVAVLCLAPFSVFDAHAQQQGSAQTITDTWITGHQASGAQSTAADTAAAGTIGKIADAAAQQKAQLALQQAGAAAYSTFTPSDALCRFGTLTRSMAASNTTADETMLSLSSMMLGRALHRKGEGGETPQADLIGQLDTIAHTYIDPLDNDGTPVVRGGCTPGSAGCAADRTRINKDIDVMQTLLIPQTININIKEGSITPGEQDIMTLLTYLSGQETTNTFSRDDLERRGTTDIKMLYQDIRHIAARRGVVNASLSSYIAQKAKGGKQAGLYLASVMTEMGLSDAQAVNYIGTDQNSGPSYSAQMNTLTKTIYQNPNYYVGLMDKPANVGRNQVSMQAFKLMQRRDMFEGALRREMLLSQLLEMEISAHQKQMVLNDQRK